ncbi:MAG: hypothetical protein ACR2QE_02845 [Acidimicrobiales bacterium]
MARAWPSSAGELADQLAADVELVLAELEAHYAPDLALPATFGGHPVGPDVAADLAYTLGLLFEGGVDTVAGQGVLATILEVLRTIDGPGTNTFYSYRASETLGRLGGFAGNAHLAPWTEAERANLAVAVDSSDFEGAFDDGLLPNNFAIVLARAEYGRRALGLVEDEAFYQKVLARSAELLATADHGWIDDAGDDRGQFDIYTPDMFLFAEPLAEELGGVWRAGFRRVIDDAARLAQPGGAIVWGRSIGALGLAMSVELGSVAIGRELTDDEPGWLARAAHAAGVLTGWFRRGVLDSHVERATMFYRGPARRLQMTLDITGKLLQAAHELRRRPEVEVGPVASAFADTDSLVRFDDERPRGVWSFRRRNLQFVVPGVGGYIPGYSAGLRSPGLWEPPTDGPVAFEPVVHHNNKQRYFQAAPVQLEHTDGQLVLGQDTLGEPGQLTAPDDAPSGSRTARFTVEGRTLVIDESLSIERGAETVKAVAWALPERADRPYRVEAVGLGTTDVSPVRSAHVSGVAEWWSFWGAPTRVHEFDAEPAPEMHVQWRLTPKIRVGGTAGDHSYPSALFGPVRDRILHGLAPIDDIWGAYDIDVLHMHWPEWYSGVDPERTAAVIRQFQEADTRILWTMHNLMPHMFRDEGAVESYRLWAAAADGVIHHTQWGKDRAQATYEYGAHTRHEVIAHGHWADRHGTLPSRSEASTRLGLPDAAIRIGVIGAPRLDKNVQLVIDGFHQCRRDDIQLVLFSKVDEQVPDDDRIVVFPWTHVSDDEYGVRVAALDALVLPFEADDTGMLMTGTLFDVIGFDKAAICSDWEVLRETLGNAGLYYGSTAEDLAALLDGLSADDLAEASAGAGALRPAFDWTPIAEQTAAFIDRLVSP